MKKYILAAAAVICAAGLRASAIAPDTLMKVSDAHRVIITESPEGLNYTIQGSDADSSLVFSYTQPYSPNSRVHSKQSKEFHFGNSASLGNSRWDIFTAGLGLGMISATGAPAGMQLEMGKSFEINWLYALGVRYRTTWNADLSLGMGFAWRNYRSTVAPLRMVSGDMNVGFEPWAEGSTGRHTAIKVFTMQFPLMYTQLTNVKIFGNRLKASAGAVLNVSTYASVKNGWTDTDGQSVRECFHGVGQRKATVDFIGVVGTQPLSVYLRYSPQSVLAGNTSPRFKSLSVGLMLLF